jgi:hypothetical protein
MPVGFIISTHLRKMIEPRRVDGGLHKTTAEVGKNASRNGKNAAAYGVDTARRRISCIVRIVRTLSLR